MPRPASVAQWRERPLAEREAPGSSPGGGAHSLVVQSAGHAALDHAIEVRILARELRRRTRLVTPLSYCGWPGSAPGGGSRRSWPNRQRHRFEKPEVRVRIPPSVRVSRRSSPTGRGVRFRTGRFRVRIPGAARKEEPAEGWRRHRSRKPGEAATPRRSSILLSSAWFSRPLRLRVRSRGSQPRGAGSSPAGATRSAVGELGRPRQFHTLKIVGSNPTCATGPVSSNGRMRGCYPRNAGSSPAAGACFPTLVAQWTERPPPKREAAGSTPAEGTAAPNGTPWCSWCNGSTPGCGPGDGGFDSP